VVKKECKVKISIFVPTYNRKIKLSKAISSIREQSYDNWELFIIDDGSTDGTLSMIEELGESRIKYIQFNENRGHPVAIYESNVLNQITGDLVIFIGADDYFLENTFSRIVEDFNIEDSNIWKIGYLWKGEGREELVPEQFENAQEGRYLSNEVLSDRYIKSDYLFVYRKNYWREYSKYFVNADHFYMSFFDVAMNACYIEKHFPIYIMVAGWGEDNITKGFNSDKYFRWSTISKEYIFQKYETNMGRITRANWIKSLILNLYTSKGSRLKSLRYLYLYFKELVNDLLNFIILSFLFFIPSSMLKFFKKTLFRMRKYR
jgi:glycosyltransferase involved in cell wall biosynthesis